MQISSQERLPQPPWNRLNQLMRRTYPSPQPWPPLPSKPKRRPPHPTLPLHLDQRSIRHPLQAPQRENNPRHLLFLAEGRLQQAAELHRRAEHFRELAREEARQAGKLEERAWQWVQDLERGRLQAQEAARQAVAQRELEARQAAVVQAEVQRRVEEARRELVRRDQAAAAGVDLPV